MSSIDNWSTTAASNNSASPDGFPENMAPSGVNDSSREVMAAVRAFYDQIGRNFITGLKLSKNGSDADAIDVAAGAAWDDGPTELMDLSAGLSAKALDTTWAVGASAGCLESGGSYSANTMYYIWLIKRVDTNVVDVLASASATSPTMPTNYTLKRLIGAVRTDGTPDIIAFTQVGDYFRYTGDVILDVDDSSITNDTFETGTLSAPPNSIAHVYGLLLNTTSTGTLGRLHVRTNGAADAADNNEAVVLRDASSDNFERLGGNINVLVDSSSQIQYTASSTGGSATVRISTYGFTMLTRSNP